MMITMYSMSSRHIRLRAALRRSALCLAVFCMANSMAAIASGADAASEHAGDHKSVPLLSVDIGSAICNLVIFLSVLGILSKFVWPVILGGLQAREDKIFDELEKAEKANKEAQKLQSEYQGKLDEAASEVQSILTDARNDATASGQRIVDEAKEEAERQRERAVGEIETAKKVALAELAGQTSDLAIGVAQQVIGRELKPEDHAELIRQSLAQLPSNN